MSAKLYLVIGAFIAEIVLILLLVSIQVCCSLIQYVIFGALAVVLMLLARHFMGVDRHG